MNTHENCEKEEEEKKLVGFELKNRVENAKGHGVRGHLVQSGESTLYAPMASQT